MITDRRRAARESASLAVTIHGKGTRRLKSSLKGFSRYGGHLSGICLGKPSGSLWVTLPGLAPQRVDLSWSTPDSAGLAFAHPLHPAVTAHVAKYHVAYTDEPADDVAAEADDVEARPPASRREQIMRGYVGPDRAKRSQPMLAVRPVC